MVDTFSAQYSMPVKNESGYVIMLPNIQNSDDLFQNPHPDPYAQSAIKLFPLGTKLIRGEQVWRYCYNGDTGLNISEPIQSAARVHVDADDDITVNVLTAIGGNVVILTSSSGLATSPGDEINEYEDGYLFINNDTGEGQSRKIKSNEAFNSSDPTEFVLYEAITIATEVGVSDIGLTRNPYRMVIATVTPLTGMCVGVPGIPVSINYYFWSQTGGPCGVLTNAVIALGTSAVVGTTSANADPGNAATTEIVIGYPLTPGVTELEQCLIFLTLDS